MPAALGSQPPGQDQPQRQLRRCLFSQCGCVDKRTYRTSAWAASEGPSYVRLGRWGRHPRWQAQAGKNIEARKAWVLRRDAVYIAQWLGSRLPAL